MYPLAFVLLLLLTPAATALHASSASIPPVYGNLKNLHLNTVLVENGRAAATIVVPSNGIYDTEAVRKRAASYGFVSIREFSKRHRRDGRLCPDRRAERSVPESLPLVRGSGTPPRWRNSTPGVRKSGADGGRRDCGAAQSDGRGASLSGRSRSDGRGRRRGPRCFVLQMAPCTDATRGQVCAVRGPTEFPDG